jgi:hypothetical protein
MREFSTMAKGLAILIIVWLASLPIATTGQTREEAVLWTSIQNSTNIEDYRAYLDAYPNGTFAPLAKRRIANMVEAKLAADKAKLAEEEARAEALRQSEIKRFIVPVVYLRNLYDRSWGYLTIADEAISFTGSDSSFVVPKKDVTSVLAFNFDGYRQWAGISFETSPESRKMFFHVDPQDVSDRTLRKTRDRTEFFSLIVEKWGFIQVDNPSLQLLPQRR